MSELPTGTVTLLLADVEDSTRLRETQPRRPKGRRQLGISDTEIDASVQATLELFRDSVDLDENVWRRRRRSEINDSRR